MVSKHKMSEPDAEDAAADVCGARIKRRVAVRNPISKAEDRRQCPLDCTFIATCKLRLIRHLTETKKYKLSAGKAEEVATNVYGAGRRGIVAVTEEE